MNVESRREVFLRFVKAVLLIELALFIIVGLIYWLSGWQTVYQYGQGLVWGGIVALGIGALDLMYYWSRHLGDYTGAGYLADLVLDKYRLKLKEKAIEEHIKDPGRGETFFLLMVVAGAIAIVVGVLIQKIG